MADTGNDRLQKLSPLGKTVAVWGQSGQGGEYRQPFDVTVDADDSVYVADTGNHRIQKLSATGTLVGAWGSLGAGEFNAPRWLAVDSRGEIYVLGYV